MSILKPMSLALLGAAAITGTALAADRITTANAAQVSQVASHTFLAANDFAWMPDGKTVAVATNFGIQVYDLTGDTEPSQLTDFTDEVDRLAFSPDGKLLAFAPADMESGDNPGAIHLWDMEQKAERALLKDNHIASDLLYSPDGAMLVTNDGDRVRLWDTATGAERLTIQLAENDGQAENLRFSTDGKTLLFLGSNSDKVHLVDVAAAKALEPVVPKPDVITSSAALSPDGTLLAAGEFGKVHLFDKATGSEKQVFEVSKNAVRKLAFTPDGKTLVVYANGQVQFWDVAGGQQRAAVDAKAAGENVLLFNADGSLLVTKGEGQLLWWDVAAGTQIASIDGIDAPEYGLKFNPDETTLGILGEDDTVSLWSVAQ
jgi:WD40 repeat protein